MMVILMRIRTMRTTRVTLMEWLLWLSVGGSSGAEQLW